jgi:tRNA-binding protein
VEIITAGGYDGPLTENTPMPDKPQIPFDDFIKLDLRVATVKAAEPHPNADRLLKIQLDDGTPDGRQVCAGIRQWYEPESLVGQQVIIVANLEPRKIRGELSQGMILAASDIKAVDDNGEPTQRDVIVSTVEKPVKPGSSVS